jgi:hypothetical protein
MDPALFVILLILGVAAALTAVTMAIFYRSDL